MKTKTSSLNIPLPGGMPVVSKGDKMTLSNMINDAFIKPMAQFDTIDDDYRPMNVEPAVPLEVNPSTITD